MFGKNIAAGQIQLGHSPDLSLPARVQGVHSSKEHSITKPKYLRQNITIAYKQDPVFRFHVLFTKSICFKKVQ